jgi:hypothetical protein
MPEETACPTLRNPISDSPCLDAFTLSFSSEFVHGVIVLDCSCLHARSFFLSCFQKDPSSIISVCNGVVDFFLGFHFTGAHCVQTTS